MINANKQSQIFLNFMKMQHVSSGLECGINATNDKKEKKI